MKKGSRKDSLKQIKRIKPLMQDYMSKFTLYGEIAYKLYDAYPGLDETTIRDYIPLIGFNNEDIDEMGIFLITGQYGRLREEAINGSV